MGLDERVYGETEDAASTGDQYYKISTYKYTDSGKLSDSDSLIVTTETSASKVEKLICKYAVKKSKKAFKASVSDGNDITVEKVSPSNSEAIEESGEAISLNKAISTIVNEQMVDITTVEKRTKYKKVAYKTVYRVSDNVRKTTRRVKRKGQAGKKASVYHVTKENGKVVQVKHKYTKTTKKAVSRVVVKGTGSVNVRKGMLIEGTRGLDLVRYSRKFIGNPYRYGGTSLRHGCDCSGFVYAIYKQFGIDIPRVGQSGVGKRVSLDDLKLGDVVFYPNHVAIYAGKGKVIHAVNESRGIRVTPIYYGGGKAYKAVRYLKD